MLDDILSKPDPGLFLEAFRALSNGEVSGNAFSNPCPTE
jgi:hypothetical protein